MTEGRFAVSNAQTIEAFWRDHFAAPFPASCRGLQIEDYDFVYVDSLVAGCVSTYVEQRALDTARLDLLRECLPPLAMFRESAAPDAIGYLTRLERLAALVMEASSRPES